MSVMPKYKDIIKVNTWARSFDKCCSYRDFEIYCNEELIWSAINNEKRVPNLEGIII